MEVLAVSFAVNSILDVADKEQSQNNISLKSFLHVQTLTPHGWDFKRKEKPFVFLWKPRK